MSTNDFWDLVEQKKKKKLSDLGVTSPTTTVTKGVNKESDAFWSKVEKYQKEEEKKFGGLISTVTRDDDDDDIAPVRKKDEKGLDFFQKSSVFDDGYNFGDVTKTILGTAGDAGLGIVKGVAKMGEGLADLVGYGVAGVADATGHEIYARGVRKRTQENVIDDITRGADDYLNKYSVLGRTSDSVMEGIGQVGTVLLTGGLGSAAGLGAAGTTALTTGLMGASGMGSGMSEAYQGGATDEEAVTYGAISGAADALTELIFGGLGKTVKATGLSVGLSSADDMLAKKVSSLFTNQIAQNLAEYGIKAGAEGFEEVLAGVAQGIGKHITYQDEKKLGEILKDENLLEQFVVGAVTSGIAQVGDLSRANRTGRDFVSGMTQNEQAVVDHEYNKRLAEMEEKGEVTGKEKAKLYDRVVEDMDKGYISIDTIEEVLGGDTFKSYRDTIESEDALQAEFDTLNKMKQGDMTGEQIDRRAELKEQLKEIQANSQRGQLKSQLSDEVFNLAKNERLVESYNEKARRSQAFEADLTQYDAKQQAVIKKAAESGILNNTNRTHEFVDMVAKISADKGVLFDFTNNAKLKESGFAVDGKFVNGYVTKDGITVNIQSSKSLNSIVGHEIAHVLEGTDLYNELQSAVVEYAKTKGDYQNRYDTLTKLYESIEGANVDAELTADLVGDYLFTDADFINNLSTNHRNVFQKIYDEVKYLLKVATAGSKEARELEKVKRAFEKAYKADSKVSTETDVDVAQESPTQYSVSVTDPETIDFLENQEHVTTYKAMVLIDGKLYPPMASKVKGEDGKYRMTNPRELGEWQQATEDTANIKFNDKGIGYYDLKKDDGGTVKAAYNPYEHSSNLVLNDQFEAAYKRDNLVTVECEIPVSELTSGYKAEHAKDSTGMLDWKSGIVAGKLKDNKRKVYLSRYLKAVRILSDAETAAKYKEIVGDTPVPFNVVSPGLLAELEKIGVNIDYEGSPNYKSHQRRKAEKAKQKADAKYSLSAEQQEYFKDSVVRDEEGNLKVMYHGTSKGGHTVFDTYGSNYGLFGQGSYFTDSKDIAQSYTKKGKGKNPQVYEAYLNIKNPMDMDAPADPAAWAKTFPDATFPEAGTNEDFYRAMEEYFEDNEYPRWEAAETAMDAIMGMGYDGITHIGGGRVNADGERHQVYIAFEPEQIKNIDNAKPTTHPDIRYSLSDNDYLDAVKSGDTETAQKMVDEAAKAAGYTIKSYHGTLDKKFTEFRKDYVGNRFGYDETGFFFIDRKSLAEDYATSEFDATRKGRVLEVYLKAEKPMVVDAKFLRKEGMGNLYRDNDPIDLWDTYQSYFLEEAESRRADAIILDDGSTKMTVVFEPNQIKSADPITYDKSGKVIPLSKRFNTANNDIRYSLSEDSEGRKLSDNQSAYFNGSKVVDGKGNLKVMYHGTPNGDFTVFKDGTYFTDNKEYADRYQNPGASSISTGKKASNPKTFEVYLDIKKPFDINDAEARRIYIDDYIKGGNAMGIDPYQSDAEYAKIKTIDWTEGEDLREFLIDNGYDYDGLVLDEGATGGYGDEVKSRGKSYVVFSPEQVKSVDNKAPSSDPDIRFSLSEAVEETKDLMALHNLHTNEVLKQFEMGGMPYPSVAITNPAKIAHEDFGEISIILQKDAIDPKKNKYNHIYSSDAYTPTFPHVSYEANREVAERISNRIKGQFDKLPDYYQRSIRSLRDYTNLNDILNRWGGMQGLIDSFVDDHGMKQVYLAEKGENVPMEIERTETQLSDLKKEQYQKVVDRIGKEEMASLNDRGYHNTLGEARIAWTKEHLDTLKDIYAEDWSSDGHLTKEEALEIANEEKLFFWYKEAVGALEYMENGGITVVEKEDYNATNAKIDEKTKDSDYKQWLAGLFGGIEGQSGIRNSKDTFLPSGKRRSFSQLHDPVTIDNVIKAMRKKEQTGQGAFGTGNFGGAAVQEYGSIAEAKRNSNMLGVIDEAEYNAIKKRIDDRLFDITYRYANGKDIIDAKTTIVEAVAKYESKAGIANYLKQYDYVYKYTDDIAEDVIELRDYVRSLPRPYFEAKPRRAVGFDEVAVFVIPRNADVKLKQELLNRGYSIAEYDPKVEGDRQRVVNQFEEFKFSLSDVGQQQKQYGNYNVYGKDIALETAEEIAPVKETQLPQENSTAPEVAVSKMETTTEDLFPDEPTPQMELDSLVQEKGALESRMMDMANNGDFSSFDEVNERYNSVMTRIAELEDEISVSESGRLDSIGDEDAPPEMDAPYLGEPSEPASPVDPFADRDMVEVGNRKVKAYQYENPEVKPFFREAAYGMLEDLHSGTKGEKWYNDDLYYESGGEKGWFGTKRTTTDDIADLLDNWHYTYDQIEQGLNAIIEDDGKENNAVSKRIEFMLDYRLRNGYSSVTGEPIPANQEYINLLNEKRINEYSEEAFNRFMETADRYAPAEDLAPVAAPAAQTPIESAPIREDYEAIRPKRKTEPRMVRVDKPVDQTVANVLSEEPKVQKKTGKLWSMVQEKVLDNGMVFENVSLEKKNRDLQAKWNFIRSSQARAQKLIGEGTIGVKSLNSIREQVEKSGKSQQFSEYLYHKHNIDRMRLAERYEDMMNKPVFGDTVTAEVSEGIVARLERTNPAFKRYAQDVYKYNNHLRQIMVDNGVISQEVADLWAEMYPHYVPIRRDGDTGLNVNVPLDTGKTGINAPVKRATGGSRDILPLFDTMAQRTIQTYKAIAKNSFGVELKNTLGTTIAAEQADVDSAIDSVDNNDALLKKGEKGNNPTFTVFENGEKVTFEITDEMYNALKPKSEGMAYTNKALNTASNLHRGVLTEYNPVFMITNMIKDAQDVLINSQHPLKTYMKMPQAVKELARKGQWYQEYMDNGGGDNTYFDNDSNTFDVEAKGIKKVLGIPPLSWISEANNFVERIPRLSEYIASRENGQSVEVSMLDAARVTTNFAAGGHLTKFLNRNGATFLNASVQGAVQQARNFREARMNGLKGWMQLATKFAVAGLPALLLNGLLWDDDEDYEELSDYVKQNYYVVAKYGDGKFVRIPKGRTMAVIQNAFEQVSNALTGDDEVDLKTFLELAVSNLAPNNPIDNNILAPIIQVANNETWYGEDLVPTRLQDLPAEEQYDESTDAISKWLGEKIHFSPYKINYLLDQYSGGIGDTFLPMFTPEAESGDNTFLGNMVAPLKSKFTTDSVTNNQNVSDFYALKEELTTNAKASTATDKDILMNKYLNSVNAEISELYAQKREYQNSKYSDAMKHELVRKTQEQIVALMEEGMNAYQNVSINGDHAVIGDRHFQLNDGEWQKMSEDQVTKYEATSAAGDAPYATDGTNHYRWYVKEGETEGEWRKITDEQFEKQNEVTSALGISPEEYWGNKEEYDYAYKSPESYALAKSVGGYETYTKYADHLNDIKADKDEWGESISGTRKPKVKSYIYGLNIPEIEKHILFKSQYPSTDTYNQQIVEYLDSREDISWEEMKAILIKLDFKVSDDGVIRW